MRTNIIFWLFLLVLVSMFSSSHVGAVPNDKKKSVGNNGERQREYSEAVNALKDQVFLLSLYSFVDNEGRMAGIEPEGNFITVNKDKFMMQKSAALVLTTFSGSDHMKGILSDFKLKESKNGNIQFSFVMTDGDKSLIFKGKMNKGDNIIEGSIKGKKEEREISVSANIQPVKSHFNY